MIEKAGKEISPSLTASPSLELSPFGEVGASHGNGATSAPAVEVRATFIVIAKSV